MLGFPSLPGYREDPGPGYIRVHFALDLGRPGSRVADRAAVGHCRATTTLSIRVHPGPQHTGVTRGPRIPGCREHPCGAIFQVCSRIGGHPTSYALDFVHGMSGGRFGVFGGPGCRSSEIHCGRGGGKVYTAFQIGASLGVPPQVKTRIGRCWVATGLGVPRSHRHRDVRERSPL